MTNSLTNPLAQYIAKNGLAIIEDEKLFESVIRDLYNNDERDRNLLIRSIELKIPQEILSNQKRSEFNLSLNKIVVHLCDAHGLEKNNAEWVVETWSEALSPKEISIDLGNGIRLELVLIPAGSFKVEFFTTKTGQGYFKEQGEITFKKSFYMGKFAITQEQWETYSKENISKFIGNNLPITNISWHDSLKFIQKLNAISDGGFRLPIRAEWEYACRAGSISLYSFGDQITPNDANYCESKIEKPTPVGSYKPNDFGLFEMHGNVEELCVSCRDKHYNTYSLEVPQFKFENGELNYADNICISTHGGSYRLEAEAAKSNHSWDASQHYFRHDDVGFRLVKDNHFSFSNTSQNKESLKPLIQNDTFSNLIQASMLAEENANRLAKETAKWLAEENAKRINKIAALASFNDGTASALRKDFQATINHFTRVIELDPSFAEAYLSRGNTYAALKAYHEAVSDYTLVLKLDPENVDTINSRGIAYHRLKKYPEAINDYTRAIEMNPSEADIYCNRGLSFSDLGRHELALGDYIQAIRLNPSHEKARIYLKKARHQLKDTHYLNITKINQVKSLEIPNKSKFFIYICIWIIIIFSGIGLIPNYFYSIETSIEKGMVLIPPGTFFMGSLITEKERETRHAVTLTKPFYLSKYEVTQEQWQVVMGNNPSSKAREAKLPVTDVSWEDCQEFIKKLNAKTNGGYRLPTEAEWEYACRAGTTTEYSFGDSLTKSDANYGDGEAGRIKLGGSYKPNAFGLYDMHGNVFEWCEDWNGEYPLVSIKDPKGPVVGEIRVMRGGSFLNDASKASSSYRSNAGSPSLGFFNAGFRLARTVVSDGVKESKKEIKKSLQNKEELKESKKEIKNNFQNKEEGKAKQDRNSNFLFIQNEMVLIQPDKFKMGSPVSEYNRSNDEIQHEVTLSKPFFIGRYEVTQEDWARVMDDSPSRDIGAKLPVTNVSWEDCQDFIKKLNMDSEGGYRLPTEAEWEYACRAGANTSYSYGDNLKKSDVNYQGQRIIKVGSYNPNAFGLYDMHGNVWEWCEDRYGTYPTGSVMDPKGPEMGLARVLRGGAFLSSESATRCSARSKNLPTSKGIAIGFRLARTP